jgi:hypothetical protein
VHGRIALLAACAAPWVCSPAAAQEPARVIPIYLMPRDASFSSDAVRYQIQVLRDVRRWYGRVLGGRTFVSEPLTVQVSRYRFAELAADSFQAWWPLLQREFADYGRAWNRHAKFKLLFLTHTAGAWAGSDSENGGLDSAGEAGRVDKGNWGGLAVIGDSSVAGVLAGVCPEVSRGKADSSVATAWWCSGSTYRGTVAHELGHTFGLPHPDAFRPEFRCADSTAYTIMQCHWWWGRAGLLDYEITHLRSLDFFAFDTLPAYRLVADQPPLSASHARRIRLSAGDSLAWIDGRGGGTGYPWAIELVGQGAVLHDAVRGSHMLAMDLGLARGATGDASVVITADGRPLALYRVSAGHPPQRVVLALRQARQISFSLSVRHGRGPVVLGNPILYR